MSRFLVNLINRHQDKLEIAQPRKKSIFEPEAISPVPSDTDVTDAPIPQQHQENGAATKAASPEILNVAKTINAQPSLAPTSSALPAAVQSDGSENLPATGKHHLGLMYDQLQSVLVRLATDTKISDSTGVVQRASIGVDNHSGLTHALNEILDRRIATQMDYSKLAQTSAKGVSEQPVSPKTRPDGQVAEPLTKPSTRVPQIINPPVGQGLLQAPNWLAAMQADLNNRLQGLNGLSQTEPVINVSIGRIEIRAQNPEPTKPGATGQKPSGVLSLEEYLKQRDRKGGA